MMSEEEEEGRRASLAGLRGLVLLTRALTTPPLSAVALNLCTSCSVLIFTSFPVTQGFVLPPYVQKGLGMCVSFESVSRWNGPVL